MNPKMFLMFAKMLLLLRVFYNIPNILAPINHTSTRGMAGVSKGKSDLKFFECMYSLNECILRLIEEVTNINIRYFQANLQLMAQS